MIILAAVFTRVSTTMSAGMVQEIQGMPYTYHLKDANNHDNFLALTLIFNQFQGNSAII